MQFGSLYILRRWHIMFDRHRSCNLLLRRLTESSSRFPAPILLVGILMSMLLLSESASSQNNKDNCYYVYQGSRVELQIYLKKVAIDCDSMTTAEQRASLFSWEHSAVKTLGVYRQCGLPVNF